MKINAITWRKFIGDLHLLLHTQPTGIRNVTVTPRLHFLIGNISMVCERRFNMLYQYHIRVFLHFIGKNEMNILFYLLRSMGKMSDRVQDKSKAVDTSVFHFGLIRMLVMEELKKRNIPWEQFIVYAHMQLDITYTPQSKMQSHLPSTSVAPARTSRKEREKPLLKTNKSSRKLKKQRGRLIILHGEVFHLLLHLNWKKSLYPLKPQPGREENCISLHLFQQLT